MAIVRERPISLSANVSLVPQTTIGAGAIYLKNPTGEPFYVQEINFYLSPTTYRAINGGVVACNLMLDRISLTNGFVPIWLLGRSINWVAESGLQNLTGGLGNYYYYYNWTLDKPLYIPAGKGLFPQFAHLGGTDATISASITVSGRTVFGKPIDFGFAPYVTSYVSDGVLDNATGTYMSTDQQLTNQLDVPLDVYRFTGRLSSFTTSASKPVFSWQTPTDFGKTVGVSISRSDGAQFIPVDTAGNYAPFYAMFGQQRAAIECRHILDPNMFYVATINKITGGAETGTYSVAAHVGMIGYRLVDYTNI